MAGRFSFSTPGRGRAEDPWFRLGDFDVTTTIIVTFLCVVGVLVEAISPDTWDKFVLWPAEVRNGEVWRLLTWPLANEVGSGSFWSVIAIALFWYFGRELEGRLGRNRFLVFLLLVTLVPALVGTALDTPDYGISAVQFGIFLVFVADNLHARFFFGIPAWVLAVVLVALNILQLMSNEESERIVVLLVSIATALITARSMGLARDVPWIPAIPIGDRSGGGRRRSAPRRGRGGVVAGPWSGAGEGSLPQPPPRPAPTAADQAELDSLLDKISTGGMDQLSNAEKRRLNELSKRMRGG